MKPPIFTFLRRMDSIDLRPGDIDHECTDQANRRRRRDDMLNWIKLAMVTAALLVALAGLMGYIVTTLEGAR